MTTRFDLSSVHPSWLPHLEKALDTLPPDYREKLLKDENWLPGPLKMFNAFSIPIGKVNYVLFGESPYPRSISANGYAFWDAAVTNIWSETGLSKQINRATSMRNIIKMLLIGEGLLDPKHTTQPDIASIDKKNLIQTNEELFTNLIDRGFLLLNATLVLQTNQVKKDARLWQPFLSYIIDALIKERPNVQFLLLGNIANEIDPLITQPEIKKLYAEHPYNISFINNKEIIEFFRPFHLLRPKS